jgi:hypothetical protein
MDKSDFGEELIYPISYSVDFQNYPKTLLNFLIFNFLTNNEILGNNLTMTMMNRNSSIA